ncbi:helix-turn-helix domain-containing protein [Paenibacillus sp. DMB20]|uniref:helix-turn-helix domain-containing protein n=1 Tax=Paenibacillus sp. DMB20 TaxID=1642570 RepID=UPI00062760F1|nr:AraC family transcriptional regulator [Paenibacillus sp. DMB20]KKO52436.1 transcriptional regulator [Paenibacillus sp. DMB20]
MTTGTFSDIDAVIAYIHEHIYDPLPLSRLAEYASYSPYHFSRLFKEKMGLSPLYYVSSIRLQKAKHLLLHTRLSVRDIAMEIGQQSLGTFTTRFTERVGISPAQFRCSAVDASDHFSTLHKLKSWTPEYLLSSSAGKIEGIVQAAEPFHGVILIGLFPKPIPEGVPLYGTLLSSLGYFSFANVKPGTYYLMATSVSWGMGTNEILLPQATLRTRSRDPIVVRPGLTVPKQQVMLYPPSLDDPPILISLSLLMQRFLSRISAKMDISH